MRIFTSEVKVACALERADRRVVAVAWSDALTFGRLGPSSDLANFSAERSEYLGSVGWDEDRVAAQDFELRNGALETAIAGDTYFLFGSTLRDQMQLAQISSFLDGRPKADRRRCRVQVVDGSLDVFSAGALLEVARDGQPLADDWLSPYVDAWRAALSSNPVGLERLWAELAESGDHPILAAALERWLQELPSSENGLSVTECQVLDAVRLGVHAPQALFEAVQETEAEPFRMNWEFWQVLNRLCGGSRPLLSVDGGTPFLCPPKSLAWDAFHAQRLLLTDYADAVLGGESGNAGGDLPGRWLGGVWIDRSSDWYWDYASRQVARAIASPQQV